MNIEIFKHWYENNKFQINTFKIRENSKEGFIGILMLFSMIGVSLIASDFIIELFNNDSLKKYTFILTIAIFLIDMIVFIFVTDKIFKSFSQLEKMSLILYKISIQIKINKEKKSKKEIRKSIELLKMFSEFGISAPSTKIYKEEIEKLVNIYDSLENITPKLIYLYKKDKLSKDTANILEKIAFHLYDENTEELVNIVKKFNDTYTEEDTFKSFKFKDIKIMKNRFISFLILIIMSLGLSVIAHIYIGISKDVTAYCFAGLVGTIALIIFQKR